MRNKNFSLNNKAALHGLLVKAKEGVGKNPQFKLPKIPNDCIIIFPKDIIGSNRVEISKKTIPLLASSSISYIDQPLFGIFAPSLDRVEKLIKKIKISYIEKEESDKKKSEDISIDFNKGNYDEELKTILDINSQIAKDLQKSESPKKASEKKEILYNSLKSKLKFDRIKSNTNQTTKVIAELVDDNLNIYSPTQWPAFIVNSVSTVCGFNKKKIIVHREKTFTKKDEMLIQPAILASIAALAAIKTNKIVYIHDNISSIRPEVNIERETWYSIANKKTLIEKINVTIEQGASQIFYDEMSKQYIAGLIPLYDLKAIKINFIFIKSPLEPAHFYGGLGYVNAIASTQIHTTKLGKIFNLSPYFWISKSLFESTIHKTIFEMDSIQDQKEILQDLVERSFFNRKYAAYKVNSALDKTLSTFTPYARGIGLAIAPSISGFSSSHEAYATPKINLTLNFDGKAELNTSFFNKSKGSEIWKKIISKELDVKVDDIEFSKDGPDLIDSGPSVLSSNSGIMAVQVKLACDKINEKRFIERLPISVTVGGVKKNNKTNLFSSNSWIALIIEASVNPLTLEAVVYKVWANCSIGTLVDEIVYKSNLKQVIVNCLNEIGAITAKGNAFNIDIKINQKYAEISDSITSGLKGVVTAAFNTALEMALNIECMSLPTSSENILSLIGDDL